MNTPGSLMLLIGGIIALQYEAYLLFGASVVGAVLLSPRAWLYITGASVGILLLKHYSFPSWEILSFILVAAAYGFMTSMEEKPEMPPIMPYPYPPLR